ncbi:MAG: hypothetical protein JWQ70_3097 [Aeromicrobium sp.]|nr:hypothetical protein [Aeromicrobium sp.]
MTLFGSKLAIAKAVIGSIVVLDLVTLGAFGFHSTKTTTTSVAVAAPPAAAAPTDPSATPDPLGPDGSGVPIGATDLAANTQQIATGGKTTTPPKDDTDTPPPDDFVAAKCPIELPEPAHDGGLQSLITFAPAFGPFKDEAFAAAAAYQPALQLLGPILAQYPKFAPTLEPALDPLLNAFEGLLDAGYKLLGPYYAPYRQKVLKAEGDLAAKLAPYSQKLAASPLAGCLVDLEAALVNDTKPATSTS